MQPLVEAFQPLQEPLREFGKVISSSLKSLLEPGTFLGDIYLVSQLDLPQQDREAAAQRLAHKWFTRGACFYPDRWHQLWPYFQTRMAESEQSFRETWRQLVLSAIFLACNEPDLGEQPLDELYQWLRNRIRIIIEQDLLDGKTLDATPEESSPEIDEAQRLETEYHNELLEFWPLLKGLTTADLELLLAEHGDLKLIARKRGKSYPALRQERSRLLKRVLEVVSQIV